MQLQPQAVQTVSATLGKDSLRRSRRVLGPDHPTSLWAATALMQAPIEPGAEEPARAFGEDTLQRCRRVFGPDHVRTLGAAATLTLALMAVGEAEPARTLGEDTLQRCRRVLGPDHPITVYLIQAADSGHIVGDDAAADRPDRPL